MGKDMIGTEGIAINREEYRRIMEVVIKSTRVYNEELREIIENELQKCLLNDSFNLSLLFSSSISLFCDFKLDIMNYDI